MKIKVKKEGRENIFLVTKEDITKYIQKKKLKTIHNFTCIGNSSIITGADYDTKSVLQNIDTAERLAILIGSAQSENMNHALAVIKNNKLLIFDIGKITEDNLEILESESSN